MWEFCHTHWCGSGWPPSRSWTVNKWEKARFSKCVSGEQAAEHGQQKRPLEEGGPSSASKRKAPALEGDQVRDAAHAQTRPQTGPQLIKRYRVCVLAVYAYWHLPIMLRNVLDGIGAKGHVHISQHAARPPRIPTPSDPFAATAVT